MVYAPAGMKESNKKQNNFNYKKNQAFVIRLPVCC